MILRHIARWFSAALATILEAFAVLLDQKRIGHEWQAGTDDFKREARKWRQR